MKRLRRASALHPLRPRAAVLVPTPAQDVILRRPRMVALPYGTDPVDLWFDVVPR
ncbi:hypothetical protein [Sphaerisporangium fuscum]|uniref:hypothetical protein n=1 Tax=Sphaerisporangium fuscum TaxID=2835868 RepID=UPI001BDDA9B9|nr:hypothetical protein [Sphaerisporangium fuscum]